jgi:hypothetical protein
MASTVSESALSAALVSFGLEDTDDNREQLSVLVEAMAIYEEREAARGGLWKAAGANDSAHHLDSKGRRVVFAANHAKHEAALDDALDAVNYAAFYARNVRAGRIASN